MLQVGTAATVTGVGLAFTAYVAGLVRPMLIVIAATFAAVAWLALLPLSVPATVYVWHVFYRRPPAPRRGRHHVRKVVTA
jgi:hypothetical protein